MEVQLVESLRTPDAASNTLGFTLKQEESNKATFLESTLSLLRKSHSLSELRTHLSDYDLSEEINAFLDILDKTEAGLDDLRLPAEFSKFYSSKPTSSPEALLYFLEFLFLTAPFRKASETDITLENFSKSVEEFIKTEETTCNHLAKLCQLFAAIPELKSGLTTSEPVAAKIEWARNNSAEILRFLATVRVPSHFLVVLDNLYHDRFIVTDHNDASPALDSLLTAYEGYIQYKFGQAGLVSYVQKKMETQNARFGMSLRYHFTSLMRNLNCGTYDLNFEYLAQETEIDTAFYIQGMNNKYFYETARFKMVNDFEIRDTQFAGDTAALGKVEVGTLLDILSWYSQSQKNIELSDYEFFGVYLDSSDYKFKYLLPKDEIRTHEISLMKNNLSIFNNKSKESESALKVLYTTNPDPFANNSERQMVLFFDLSGVSTLGDLLSHIAEADYHTKATEVDKLIGNYPLTLDVKKLANKKSHEEKVQQYLNFNFTVDTPLSVVLKKLREAEGLAKPADSRSERTIELVCFNANHLRHVPLKNHLSSRPVVHSKLRIENIFRYLIECTDKKLEMLGRPQQPNQFNGFTVNYYLPNILLLRTSKVSDWLQLSPELSLGAFAIHAKKEYPLEKNYNLLGGVAEVQIDRNTKIFRPFSVVFDKVTGPRLEIYKSSDKIYLPHEYYSYKIDLLCYEKKVEILKD